MSIALKFNNIFFSEPVTQLINYGYKIFFNVQCKQLLVAIKKAN
jgi:hypothetical protein